MKNMKKSEKEVHPINKNFRYFLWTVVGMFILIGLASAYVYVSDDGIDMDDQPINNASDPTLDQDVATKNYTDANDHTFDENYFNVDSSNEVNIDNDRILVNKKSGKYGSQASNNTVMLTFDYQEDSYTYLQIMSDLGATTNINFTIAFFNGVTEVGRTGVINTVPSGGQIGIVTIVMPKPTQYNYPYVTYKLQVTGAGSISPPNWATLTLVEEKHAAMDLSGHPDTIKIIKTSTNTQYEDLNYQYYQL